MQKVLEGAYNRYEVLVMVLTSDLSSRGASDKRRDKRCVAKRSRESS
jgi:hypothetical protein